MEVISFLLNSIASLAGFLFSLPGFQQIKIVVSSFVIIFSLLLIGYWFYLEKKYQYGRELWSFLFEYYFEAFIKANFFKEKWQRIKNIFLANHLRALSEVYLYLEELIDLYGYEEKELLDKFKKLPQKIFDNQENFLKAVEIVSIVKIKMEKKEEIDIKEAEALSVIKEIEKGLINLFVLTPQDCWVDSLILPPVQ